MIPHLRNLMNSIFLIAYQKNTRNSKHQLIAPSQEEDECNRTTQIHE